jgi:hypothetical protein
MAIKVNDVSPVTQVPDTGKTEVGDGSFKFTLASAITKATGSPSIWTSGT